MQQAFRRSYLLNNRMVPLICLQYNSHRSYQTATTLIARKTAGLHFVDSRAIGGETASSNSNRGYRAREGGGGTDDHWCMFTDPPTSNAFNRFKLKYITNLFKFKLSNKKPINFASLPVTVCLSEATALRLHSTLLKISHVC
jgi:hypothetical protein